ncbi:MAG: MFS transporter [Rhodobacteraceae bacterium]|nr:MFS transporter [Paracoccaceae bacterium]
MIDATARPIPGSRLLPPACVAAILAFAGLPLYIHAPRYYVEEMGIGLTTIGLVLLLARGIDSLQDPLIGRLADLWRGQREVWVVIAGASLVFGLGLLFAPPAWGAPLPRLVLGLLAAFTGFSAMQIALFDHGLAQAQTAGGDYTRVALWREAGGLAGICLAALMPALLGGFLGDHLAYPGYAVMLALLAALALAWMRGNWRASGAGAGLGRLGRTLRASGLRPLLAFGFLNALPVAVTSTLFLFFVSDVLKAELHAGPMLLIFFGSAALAAPLWARLAGRIGRRRAVIMGMIVSIPAFVGAFTLTAGDVFPFYWIAVASGAALGADMTLVPAMLAQRITGTGGQIYAVWIFLQKAALAIAAGAALPLLALTGYEPDGTGGTGSLSVAYALVPCGLKLIALVGFTWWIDDNGEA